MATENGNHVNTAPTTARARRRAREGTATSTLLMVGTRKGLFIGTSDESRGSGPGAARSTPWRTSTPSSATPAVTGRACSRMREQLVGPQVRRSDDLGQTWQETPNGAVRFPEDTGANLERIWQLAPARPSDDGVVWAGTEPGAVFRSTDRGETFELVRGLWDHPTAPSGRRVRRQAFHTILPHPTDPRVLAAISTGGVYATSDGGDTGRRPTPA